MTDRLTDQRKRRSRPGRVFIGLVGVVFAANVLLAGFEKTFGGAHGGPPSSTYTTAPNGLAAYFDLLQRTGHNVTRSREPIAKMGLASNATLVALDAALPNADVDSLRAFVERGGHLIAGGSSATWIDRIVGSGLIWTPRTNGRAQVVVDVPETSGVTSIATVGAGSYDATGSALPVVDGEQGTAVAVQTVGSGRVVALADASPLQNSELSDADNAALGLAVVGAQDRPVVFAEQIHGFGQGQGVGAIPSRVRWTLGGLLLAVIAWMLWRGRRLGPAQEASRPLPPPRRLYVEAVATTLARLPHREQAIAPLLAATRDRLVTMTGVRLDDEAAVREAGMRIGMSEREAEALASIPTTDEGVVDVGRAFARLEEIRR